MKRFAPLTCLLALALLLLPATAQAGEAIEPLRGAWTAESFNGEAPPEGMKMVLTFVNDSTMRMEMTFAGETHKEEVKYTATKDGKITVFAEPDTKPEGEEAKWEIKADKKLYITSAEGEVMILKR
ncbi:MAG: hypothetical protein ACE37H_06425 [Phycisphaeraceae bacterium]